MKFIKSTGRFIVCVIFFAVTWVLNLLICGIIGSLFYDGSDEFTGAIYSLSMLFLPVVASTLETVSFSKKWAQKRNSKYAAPTSSGVTATPGTGISYSNYPTNIDYMEGHDFEYWCASLLSRIGYTNVLVTPGSGDQGVDILAEKDGIKYAIQCKRYSSDLGNTPVQEVNAGKAFYCCHVGVVMTNRHFTESAKQLAAATGVLLWDRDWINRALTGSVAVAPPPIRPHTAPYASAHRSSEDYVSKIGQQKKETDYNHFIAQAQWYAARGGADLTDDEFRA